MKPKTYTINITEQDIKRGQPKVACACPIALAAKRASGKSFVHAGPSEIIIGQKRGATPLPAMDFMLYFDTGRKVLPFEFQLTVQ